MVNVLKSDIVVTVFELQLHNYVHFRYFVKGMNTLMFQLWF